VVEGVPVGRQFPKYTVFITGHVHIFVWHSVTMENVMVLDSYLRYLS